MRQISKRLSLSGRTVTKLKKHGFSRKRRKDLIDPKIVENFLCREVISRTMTQKRFACKSGPGFLLQVSLKAAYQQFKFENPELKISFSKFASLRPRHIQLLTNTHREFCLCVYCVNVRYKLLAVSRLTNDQSKKITNENEIANVLLCQKSDNDRFHALACICGSCLNCSNTEQTLREHFAFAAAHQNITWDHWEKVEQNNTTRRVLSTKTGTGTELLEEFAEDVLKPSKSTTFIQHLF